VKSDDLMDASYEKKSARDVQLAHRALQGLQRVQATNMRAGYFRSIIGIRRIAGAGCSRT
jgi:hypothetical protein